MASTTGRWLLPLVLSALVGAACSGLGAILPHYTGPQPAKVPISDERVVVRGTIARGSALTEVGGFYADRIRFVEAGQSHDVNRVLHVSAGDLFPHLNALGIRVGDTLRISTRYDTTYYHGTPTGSVPDWPGHDAIEYPIGFHTLTAVARTR
ncbi:MAG TPA: hypothetical protein VE913_13850 [Longimicrobium sp.]|nr:hypothetical protein [Longimicrobium sp.]